MIKYEFPCYLLILCFSVVREKGKFRRVAIHWKIVSYFDKLESSDLTMSEIIQMVCLAAEVQFNNEYFTIGCFKICLTTILFFMPDNTLNIIYINLYLLG